MSENPSEAMKFNLGVRLTMAQSNAERVGKFIIAQGAKLQGLKETMQAAMGGDLAAVGEVFKALSEFERIYEKLAATVDELEAAQK